LNIITASNKFGLNLTTNHKFKLKNILNEKIAFTFPQIPLKAKKLDNGFENKSITISETPLIFNHLDNENNEKLIVLRHAIKKYLDNSSFAKFRNGFTLVFIWRYMCESLKYGFSSVEIGSSKKAFINSEVIFL
jgi:hypothetical protein